MFVHILIPGAGGSVLVYFLASKKTIICINEGQTSVKLPFVLGEWWASMWPAVHSSQQQNFPSDTVRLPNLPIEPPLE
jgi:hypothetical protein